MNIEISFVYLICNFLIWSFPFVLDRDILSPSFIFAYIFSSSYWLPAVFYILNDFVPLNVSYYYINDALLASCLAGLGFLFSYIVYRVCTQKIEYDIGSKENFLKITNMYVFFNFCCLIALILLFYCLISSFSSISIGNRFSFYVSMPFWYFSILPISALMVGLCNFMYVLSDENRTTIVVLLNVFLILMNGFDGGRRYAAIAFMFFAVAMIYRKFYLRKNIKKQYVYIALIFLCAIGFISKFRNYSIGWSVMALKQFDLFSYLGTLLCPLSTVHVNTAMVRYIDMWGCSGGIDYLKAVGNIIFPQFLFGEYVFGIPLVIKIHQEMGWHGQDFGMLAEAIYSFGFLGVFVVHFIVGFLGFFLYGKTVDGNKYYLSFYMSLIFAFLNSIRSDFMNFGKVFFYFGTLFSIFIFISEKLKKSSY